MSPPAPFQNQLNSGYHATGSSGGLPGGQITLSIQKVKCETMFSIIYKLLKLLLYIYIICIYKFKDLLT